MPDSPSAEELAAEIRRRCIPSGVVAMDVMLAARLINHHLATLRTHLVACRQSEARLVGEVAELREENRVWDALVTDIGALVPGPESLMNGIKKAVNERDSLREERDYLREENQTIDRAVPQAIAERDVLRAEVERLKRANEGWHHRVTELNANETALQHSLDRIADILRRSKLRKTPNWANTLDVIELIATGREAGDG